MLRALLYIHIMWIVVAGLMLRGAVPYPDGRTTDLLLLAAFVVFPLAVAVAVIRSDLSAARRCCVALIEAGLTLAYFIATWPGVQ